MYMYMLLLHVYEYNSCTWESLCVVSLQDGASQQHMPSQPLTQNPLSMSQPSQPISQSELSQVHTLHACTIDVSHPLLTPLLYAFIHSPYFFSPSLSSLLPPLPSLSLLSSLPPFPSPSFHLSHIIVGDVC